MQKINFLDLSIQQQRIKAELDRRIAGVLSHCQFILGPEVSELEARLVQYVEGTHCISCANGTDALQLALMAIGVGPGDEVIIPGFSYYATAEAVALLGATPVFVDINETYNIDVDKVEAAITTSTRAIMVVSLFGQCPDFDRINAIAKEYGLVTIEDAAQSFGATFNGSKSCNLADISCTSFFPSKPLGCYGDGGAVFTNDEELSKRVRMIARHGQSKRYYHEMIGVNSRLDSLQAAVLLAKLDVFDDEIKRRNDVAALYREKLVNTNLILPDPPVSDRSAWAQYSVRSSKRTELIEGLRQVGIPTVIHYPVPLNKQPALKEFQADLPVGDRISTEIFSLPFGPYMPEADQGRVVRAIENLQ